MQEDEKNPHQWGLIAEAVRFELTDGFPSPVFKTGAIDHSATLPVRSILPGGQHTFGFYESHHLINAALGSQIGHYKWF